MQNYINTTITFGRIPIVTKATAVILIGVISFVSIYLSSCNGKMSKGNPVRCSLNLLEDTIYLNKEFFNQIRFEISNGDTINWVFKHFYTPRPQLLNDNVHKFYLDKTERLETSFREMSFNCLFFYEYKNNKTFYISKPVQEDSVYAISHISPTPLEIQNIKRSLSKVNLEVKSSETKRDTLLISRDILLDVLPYLKSDYLFCELRYYYVISVNKKLYNGMLKSNRVPVKVIRNEYIKN